MGNEHKKYLNIFLTVIASFATSLHKMNQSYHWKFTITVVEGLADIIKIQAGNCLKKPIYIQNINLS